MTIPFVPRSICPGGCVLCHPLPKANELYFTVNGRESLETSLTRNPLPEVTVRGTGSKAAAKLVASHHWSNLGLEADWMPNVRTGYQGVVVSPWHEDLGQHNHHARKINHMNKQEIFDRVVLHAATQRKKSISDEGICQYRDNNGCRCFAGIFIPDDKYSPEFENISIQGYELENMERRKVQEILNALMEEEVGEENMNLLATLQACHDNFKVDHWVNEFKSIAREFDLVFSGPESIEEVLQ